MKASVAELVRLPGVWRGGELEHAVQPSVATGHARLDAELPGGGWPAAGLTELLLEAPGSGELRLLAPLLLSFSQGNAGPPQVSLLPLGGADAARRRPWGRS